MPTIQQVVEFLDEKESLRLGESPWDPGDLSEEYEVAQIDWRTLFPARRPIRTGDEPWDLHGDEWSADAVPELIDQVLRPIDVRNWLQSSEPEDDWDACAWYQPIHFHAFDWGIYIREECLCNLGRRLWALLGLRTPPASHTHDRTLLFKALVRTAFLLYYRHEFFHGKTECLGLRLHAIENKSSYVPYIRLVYGATTGTDDQLEEALANAYMYHEMRPSRHNGWIPAEFAAAARYYLEQTFPHNPPGYRRAADYLAYPDFAAGENKLMGQVHEANLHTARPVGQWALAPRLSQSFLNIRSEIWTVVRKGAPVVLPVTALPLRTCSSSEMISICEAHGYEIVPGGKGSHIKMKKSRAPMIIIPGSRRNLSSGAAKKILGALGGHKIREIPELRSAAQ